ncbi:Fc.00g102330.m01.CDS01 [Cosmosporella sp. VM-42]
MEMTSNEIEDTLKTLRILNPYPGIFAYYDGRTGKRFFSEKPNWLDDGAFTLGVSTYSIVSGNEALIYDAHITPDHARAVLRHVQSLGVIKTIVVYSHSHRDHIAGALAFGSCEIIAHEETANVLARNQTSLAQDEPPITVVMPTRLYSSQMTLQVGDIEVELHNFKIHTPDGTVLWIPSRQLLLAGDTLEDTATFISDPKCLPTHQKELQRMATFPIKKILPAHGCPEKIAAGGYTVSLIDATLRYLEAMDEPTDEPMAWRQLLSEAVAEDTARGDLVYYAQYEEVHKCNVKLMRKSRQKDI